jgi:glycolate oxidase iron-sulfur subunit
VLSAEGYDVYAPPAPRCCGALEIHTGRGDAAKERAKDTIRAFDDCDLVAVNAAGCGSSMKDYGHLFRDDPEWSERAEAFSAKTRDVSELLTAEAPVAERHPVPLRLAYHDACHLSHAQGVRTQPRKLLGDIPGLELLEPPEWELCCGSAGVYNMLNPEPARELGRRKAENLLSTGAEAIASANPGCSLQIASVLEEMGRGLPLYHPMEILAMSITGRGAAKVRPSGNGARA